MAKKQKSTVTQTVRKAVLESDRSLNEIARQTGIDVGNLSRFAHGQRGLSLENFDALCSYLDFVLVRPGGTGRLRRGIARMVVATAIAASQADPSPVSEAFAALVSVGHRPAEARVLLDKATASGRQYASAADFLATIFCRPV